MLFKFADDTKLLGPVATDGERNLLREDLQRLEKWSKDWLMPFNVEKCQIMHMGFDNAKEEYKMDGVTLEKVREERDLGMISDDFKVGKH
jgi:hypothetical protein